MTPGSRDRRGSAIEQAARHRPGPGPDDTGAVSIELTGILIVAVLLAGALVAAAAPGGPLSSSVSALYCRAFSIFGVSCDGTSTAEDEGRPEPEAACVTNAKSDTKTVGGTFVYDLDGGGTVLVEQMSDGTYRVTLQGELSGGVAPAAGGGLKVTVDGQDYGASVQAGATAGGRLAGGATWELGSKEEAEQLAEFLNDQVTYETTPVAGSAMRAWDFLSDTLSGNHYVPPEPTEYFGEAGAFASGRAEVIDLALGTDRNTRGLDPTAKVAASLGARYDTRTGDTTLYYSVNASGSVSGTIDRAGDLGVSGTGTASGEVNSVIAVTISEDGEVTDVSGEMGMYGEAGYDIDVATQIGSMFGSDAVSGGTTFGFSLDPRNGKGRQMAQDLLRASGIEIDSFTDGITADEVGLDMETLQAVAEVAMDHGEVYRKDYQGSSNTAFGLSAAASLGPGVGLRYENSSKERELVDAQYWDGDRWAPWTSCVEG